MTTAIFVANTVSINAFAAEVNTLEQGQQVKVETSFEDTTTVEDTTNAESATSVETATTESQVSEDTIKVTETVAEETATMDAEKTEKTAETTETEKTATETEKTTKTAKTTKKTTSKKKTKTTTSAKKTASKTTKASYTKAELRLLSCIIYAEAGGQSYAGKLAVGIVIMNRVQSKLFPNTLKGVIYQKYQFGPVRNGSLNSALKQYDNNKFTSSQEKQCIKAAKAALSGTKTITYTKNGKTTSKDMSSYHYFSGRLSNPRFTLGGHQFK